MASTPSRPTSRRRFLSQSLAGLSLAGAGVHRSFAHGPIERQGAPNLRTSLAAYSFRDTFRNSDKLDMLGFIDYCADHQLDGTELTSYFFPEGFDETYLLRLKQRAFLRGIAISGTAVGNNFALPKGAELDGQIADVKRWIDRAQLMGAPHIRVFAGAPKGIDTETAYRHCIAALEECCDYASKKGVFLGLENHGGIVAEAGQLLKIVEAVKSPWLGINLDTGNFHTDDPYGDLARCAPYAVNVQVKVEIRARGQDKTEADLPASWPSCGTRTIRASSPSSTAKADPWDVLPGLLEEFRALCHA